MRVFPTVNEVIVDEAASLHVCINDGAAHKFESSLDEIGTQRIRFFGCRGQLVLPLPIVELGFTLHKSPDVIIK